MNKNIKNDLPHDVEPILKSMIRILNDSVKKSGSQELNPLQTLNTEFKQMSIDLEFYAAQEFRPGPSPNTHHEVNKTFIN